MKHDFYDYIGIWKNNLEIQIETMSDIYYA